MTTTNKTFSVRNGIDVANTLLVSNTAGVINVSNVTLVSTNNVMCANGGAVYFGGNQGNTANALWFVSSNVSSNSLDFWWQ
jgi:hypothetical protein